MTTASPPNRPRRERALSRSRTKTADDRSSYVPGRRVVSKASGFERVVVETDGGLVDGDTAALQTYTDDENDYSLAYPTDWSVEPDMDGGATFEAPRSAAGAAVFVEKNVGLASKAPAAMFLDELDADEHVHALKLVSQEDIQLESGQTGQVLECAYVGDSCKRWRLAYLFVRIDDTVYTLGIDWNDTAEFDTTAAAMVESFALGAT